MNNFFTSDRILIIGGTGFIGRHLVKRCLRDTVNVACIGLSKRDSVEIEQLKVEFSCADLVNKNECESVLKGKAFDYVFNLGGYIDHTPYFKGGRRLIESHFAGLMNLIDLLDKERLKGFVQIGSSDEYGSAYAPQKETIREMPISPYSLGKAAASHFIQMISQTEGFPGTVLRLFLVYGPCQNGNRFLPQIIKGCLKGESFKTSEGAQLRDFCYVDDVVEAMVKSALSPLAKGEVINVASGKPVSIRRMIENVVKIVGKGEPLWGAYPCRKGENMELYADITLAEKLLGWKPLTNLEDGLNLTIDYYRSLL